MTDMYATHNEALAYAVCKTKGLVVELGAGWSSTPLLHGLCEAQNRQLITIESDPAWLDQFREWQASFHELVLDAAMCVPRKASVVLVDHDSPKVTRADSIRAAQAQHAEIVVVHDTWHHEEPLPVFEGLQDALDGFRYRRDWKAQGPAWPEGRPWTTALSDSIPLG